MRYNRHAICCICSSSTCIFSRYTWNGNTDNLRAHFGCVAKINVILYGVMQYSYVCLHILASWSVVESNNVCCIHLNRFAKKFLPCTRKKMFIGNQFTCVQWLNEQNDTVVLQLTNFRSFFFFFWLYFKSVWVIAQKQFLHVYHIEGIAARCNRLETYGQDIIYQGMD